MAYRKRQSHRDRSAGTARARGNVEGERHRVRYQLKLDIPKLIMPIETVAILHSAIIMIMTRSGSSLI